VLTGKEKHDERMFIFDKFRNGEVRTLFLSRIGDEAIDLPNANVGI
jgi:DNA excision repair protein ERCC-3